MLGMSKQASGLRFTLSVGNLPADAFVVAGFTLHEQFSSPFALELEVASAKPSVEFRSILDNTATLTIWRETEVQRVINGIVTSLEQGDAGLHQTRYRFSVRPSLWRAGLGHHSRIFQQQNFLEILETLLKENKISDYAHALRDPHAVREFCVQYNESDLDFINRLAAEEGIYYRAKGQATARRCNPAYVLPWKTILWRRSIRVGKSPRLTIQGSNPKRLRVTQAGRELS